MINKREKLLKGARHSQRRTRKTDGEEDGKGEALEVENKAATRECRSAGSYRKKGEAARTQLPPLHSIEPGILEDQKEHKSWLMPTNIRRQGYAHKKYKLQSKPRM